jgi:hypothetical protein
MTATCNVGTTTQTVTDPTNASCTVPLFVDGVEVAFAAADATVSGDLSGPAGLSVEGNGGFEPESGSSSNVSGSGFGAASYNQLFTTAGPERPGFISALIEFGFHGSPQASLTQNGNSYGDVVGNGPPVPEPFELGEPFQVSLFAEEGGGGEGDCDGHCAGDTFASVTVVEITEADGTTGVPFFAITTPEPATWRFLLFGLAACAVFYVRTRKAALGSREASAPNSNYKLPPGFLSDRM